MSPKDDLLTEVQAFMAEHGFAPSTFGIKALNDPGFVRGLQNGRRLWPETAAKVRAFMADFAARKTGIVSRPDECAGSAWSV